MKFKRMVSLILVAGFLLAIPVTNGNLDWKKWGAGDIFASLMTFIGNKIASVPGDENHNFGHGKAEYIFSLFISITMILVSIKLLASSINSLLTKSYFEFSWMLVIVCILTIITKFILFIYTKKLYKKYDNILLKSNYIDHRNDCLVTTCTLISILFGLLGIYWVDGLVGIGISIWILITGIGIFIESYNILMDISLDEKTKETIMELVKKHKDIKNCYNLYSAPIGYKYLVVFTIAVDGNMSTYDSHYLANLLEKEIEKIDKVDKAVVHVHPDNMNYKKRDIK